MDGANEDYVMAFEKFVYPWLGSVAGAGIFVTEMVIASDTFRDLSNQVYKGCPEKDRPDSLKFLYNGRAIVVKEGKRDGLDV